MKETKRISKLFKNLYNGNPWIDVTIVNTLKEIDAKMASKRILPKCNTIWEITNHIIKWRINVLKRMNGQLIKTPSHNYIEQIKNSTEKSWKETLIKMESTQILWVEYLSKVKKDELKKRYEVNNLTYYEHILGIIQHDAYHLGQIVLLAKCVKSQLDEK
jgi:uncharacterized damage-inducible protein DinB